MPLEDNSVDIIIADYVLEHVEEPEGFVAEVRRLLRPNGIFCARTPHKYNYISIGARMVPNKSHASYIKGLQPERKSQDVFPTAYKLNTVRAINRYFSEFQNSSYIFRTDPSYFLGSRSVYRALELAHRFSPAFISGNIFAFLRRIQSV